MLSIVGVGPGDPGLITLKAVRTLREADKIILIDQQMDNVVHQLIKPYILEKPILPLSLSIRGTHDMWEPAFIKACEQLLPHLKKQEHLVWPVIGDPSLYSQTSYILSRLQGVTINIVAGVPAPCALAAKLQMPLCKRDESLTILDGFSRNQELPQDNTIIMKSGKHIAYIKEALNGRPAYFGARLGQKDAQIGRVEDLESGSAHHFTTVFVPKE